MKLIGIKLISAEPVVRKSLKNNTWYPFYQRLEEPNFNNAHLVYEELPEVRDLYQIQDNLPYISVQCVVGMNGSGKSSLFDILFRIINNFACVSLKSDINNLGRDLQFAYGLTAKLYFETDGTIGCIYNGRKPKEMYLEYGVNAIGLARIYVYDDLSSNMDLSKVLLSRFFYTININYSTYAYNENDYRKDVVVDNRRQKTNVNGKWLGGLFHKNDGYQAPIVMTPYRKNFNIDINRETKLSTQRIVALTLLLFSQKEEGDTEFAQNGNTHVLGKLMNPDQVPDVLTYEFDKNFYKHLVSRTEKLFVSAKYSQTEASELMLRLFENAWREKIDINNIADADERNTALRYLAYKTIKIGTSYVGFINEFNIKQVYRKIYQHTSIAKKKADNLNECYTIIGPYIVEAGRLIDAILSRPSHITLKIRQCVEYIRRAGNDGIRHDCLRGQIPVDTFIADRRFLTYDEVVLSLPPSFFKLDIYFRPRQNKPLSSRQSQVHENVIGPDHYCIGQMSSGQKQWLNCMSYVCYHIKNIESVAQDDGRIPYHHVNLVFDEAELYYHPEYQRTFVARIINSLANCHINIDVIKSINILIATHSPFILSDILSENTLYLKNGLPENVEFQTFGANYYDILHNSFFLEKRVIGDIAALRIGGWVDRMREGEDVANLIPYIGDPMVKRYYEYQKEKHHV